MTMCFTLKTFYFSAFMKILTCVSFITLHRCFFSHKAQNNFFFPNRYNGGETTNR